MHERSFVKRAVNDTGCIGWVARRHRHTNYSIGKRQHAPFRDVQQSNALRNQDPVVAQSRTQSDTRNHWHYSNKAVHSLSYMFLAKTSSSFNFNCSFGRLFSCCLGARRLRLLGHSLLIFQFPDGSFSLDQSALNTLTFFPCFRLCLFPSLRGPFAPP